MKVIFLDIDGVLNTHESATTLRETFVERGDSIVGFNKFDKRCVERLNRITDATGAKIVISSSWRHMCVINKTTDLLFQHLKNEGVTGDIIDCTPIDKDCGYINEEYPDGSRGFRAFEIQKWIDTPPASDDGYLDQFVILDDDAWFMKGLEKNFIWIEEGWKTGLLDRHAERAIEVLNRDV